MQVSYGSVGNRATPGAARSRAANWKARAAGSLTGQTPAAPGRRGALTAAIRAESEGELRARARRENALQFPPRQQGREVIAQSPRYRAVFRTAPLAAARRHAAGGVPARADSLPRSRQRTRNCRLPKPTPRAPSAHCSRPVPLHSRRTRRSSLQAPRPTSQSCRRPSRRRPLAPLFTAAAPRPRFPDVSSARHLLRWRSNFTLSKGVQSCLHPLGWPARSRWLARCRPPGTRRPTPISRRSANRSGN